MVCSALSRRRLKARPITSTPATMPPITRGQVVVPEGAWNVGSRLPKLSPARPAPKKTNIIGNTFRSASFAMSTIIAGGERQHACLEARGERLGCVLRACYPTSAPPEVDGERARNDSPTGVVVLAGACVDLTYPSKIHAGLAGRDLGAQREEEDDDAQRHLGQSGDRGRHRYQVERASRYERNPHYRHDGGPRERASLEPKPQPEDAQNGEHPRPFGDDMGCKDEPIVAGGHLRTPVLRDIFRCCAEAPPLAVPRTPRPPR